MLFLCTWYYHFNIETFINLVGSNKKLLDAEVRTHDNLITSISVYMFFWLDISTIFFFHFVCKHCYHQSNSIKCPFLISLTAEIHANQFMEQMNLFSRFRDSLTKFILWNTRDFNPKFPLHMFFLENSAYYS